MRTEPKASYRTVQYNTRIVTPPNIYIYTYILIHNCLTVVPQEPMFPARVVYDLLFFFIVIIIVLNLIFGVIIDTFADLRSEKQRKEEILKTTCFICGMSCLKGAYFEKQD